MTPQTPRTKVALHTVLSSFLLTSFISAGPDANSCTFTLGDHYSSNGDGTSVGTPNTSITPTEVETTGLYDPAGNTGDPSGYNAIAVGAIYGGTTYRSVSTFSLSDVPVAPEGFTYSVNSVTVSLEVSGGTTDGRPSSTINFYEGNFSTGTLPDAKGSQLYNHISGSFVSTVLTDLTLDLNTDSEFTFTMAAPNADNGEFYTFGSGAGPNLGFTGTNAIQKAPSIIIDFDLVAVPEPSTTLLSLIGCIFGLSYRKRS